MRENKSSTPPVVVASVGAVTALGAGTAALWNNASAGQVGIGPVRGFDLSAIRTRIGGQVASDTTVREPSIAFALRAASEAMRDSGITIGETLAAERFGVVYGTCNGGWRTAELAYRKQLTGGTPDWQDWLLVPPHAGAEALSAAFGIRGPVISLNTACASGAHAIAHGSELIRCGRADAVLVGGSDSFTETAFAGFNSLESLSPRPAAPYSRDREGLSLGEGSGMLVLLSEELARQRGITPLAYVLGYGMSADGYHPTAPHPEGAGAARAIRAALSSAGLTTADVVYINGHGTGTPKNDSAESNAVRAAFGQDAVQIALSSTKSMIGHLLGAAGAVEAIVTILGLAHRMAPPTANFGETDPKCGLDPVPGRARAMDTDVALSNNFAFAGANATLALARGDSPRKPATIASPIGVVITGLSLATPLGFDPADALRHYRSGLTALPETDGLRAVPIDVDLSAAGDTRRRRRMDRLSQLAVATSRMALEDAKLSDSGDLLTATGVIVGTGAGPVESNERFATPVLEQGLQYGDPAVFPNTVFNAAAGQVAMSLGTRGPTTTITSGHAAGAAALGIAVDLIGSGRANSLVVSAVDAFSPGLLAAYGEIPVFAGNFTLSEGAGALVLESIEQASLRGVTAYARVLGYGTASDGIGVGRWDQRGNGLERAMRIALADSGLASEEIAAVWANAAGIALADAPELRAIHRVFGDIRVETPKRILGEPIGAGAQLSIVLAVTEWKTTGSAAPVLINSSSLGGTHTSIVIAPWTRTSA
ncbi:beta-ketoacyl-[acyl-carrier-protein] synthase family protein [Nocardia sp. BSTN01]|uniref:beta-ketoacyl-[acyl-carrier-protein] synthase family protein n=1 Tax=Nocardia sp. BSTN01 TaxID=2783665 RepID=UPI0018906E50|nr:beta-ketoacyl-[acyl-carrier-protein] synthase family protein [Nocardia sp. BSTN01]MBF5002324.1 beta-ketoacyl-[acyl-carrier-protein] synthase family protein [Nocardia sp. BSTN01]